MALLCFLLHVWGSAAVQAVVAPIGLQLIHWNNYQNKILRERCIIWKARTRVHRELVSDIIKNDSVAFAWLTTCKVIASDIQSNLSRTETDLWRHRTVDLSPVIHIRGQWPAQEKRNKIMWEMMNNCCLRVMTETHPSLRSHCGGVWEKDQCFSDLEELLSA